MSLIRKHLQEIYRIKLLHLFWKKTAIYLKEKSIWKGILMLLMKVLKKLSRHRISVKLEYDLKQRSSNWTQNNRCSTIAKVITSNKLIWRIHSCFYRDITKSINKMQRLASCQLLRFLIVLKIKKIFKSIYLKLTLK